MDALKIKLSSLLKSELLECAPFGRSGALAAWVEAEALARVAASLKRDPGLRVEGVENVSAIEVEGAIVVNYFTRVGDEQALLVVRCSLVSKGVLDWVELPSVSDVWMMAEPQEKEIQELYGVRFLNEEGKPKYSTARGLLPAGWQGFPLRKSYSMPEEGRGAGHA